LQKDLTLTKQQVEELNTQLSALRAQFEEKTAEQKELKAKADLMERRLIAASRLIAGMQVSAVGGVLADPMQCMSVGYVRAVMAWPAHVWMSRLTPELACSPLPIQASPCITVITPAILLSGLYQVCCGLIWHLPCMYTLYPPFTGLGSERTRWTADIEELDSRKERLVGDCLLTSSFLSYTGAFTFNYRHAMVYDMWQKDVGERKIPLTQPFR
jgi:hypothetical protein